MIRASLLIVFAALSLSPPASAGDDGPVTREAVQEDLHSYYSGERRAAIIVTSLGVVGLGAGAFLVTESGDFSRGLGWPLLTLGALEAVGGVSYIFQCNAEIDQYQAQLNADATNYKSAELEHLAGTTRRFVYYRLTELALTLGGAGVATYGLIANKPLFQGIGIGGAAVGLPFLLIDTYNNNRAAWYSEQVSKFQPALGLQIDPRGKNIYMTLSGRI